MSVRNIPAKVLSCPENLTLWEKTFVPTRFCSRIAQDGFQDQLVAINVGNISPSLFRKKKSMISSFWERRKPQLIFVDNAWWPKCVRCSIR